MSYLIDFMGIFCAFWIVIVVGLGYRKLMGPLLVGLALRLILMAVNNFGIWRVPGADADAKGFYNLAVSLHQLSWPDLLAEFSFSNSHLYSWLGAILFKLTEPSLLLFQSANLVLGIIGIVLVYRIASLLWDNSRARMAAYLVAIYPYCIFNSIITLREELSITLFLAGLLFTIRWVRSRSPVALASALFFMSSASMFHGGWSVAVVGLVAVVIVESIRSGGSVRVAAFNVVSAVFLLAFLTYLGTAQIQLSSGIGNPFEQIADGGISSMEASFDKELLGGSAYPAWIGTGNPVTQPWLIPGRMVYFLFSPFPWDIGSVRHLSGGVGTIGYLWLAVRIYRGRFLIRQSPECRAVLLITGMLVFVFAIGTSNVGTSLRHRTKVFAALAILAVGWVRKRRSEQDSARQSRIEFGHRDA